MKKLTSGDPMGETRPLIAIVFPHTKKEQPYEVYVIWKAVKFDEEGALYKIHTCQNVIIPDMKGYYDNTDILALHEKIEAQIASDPNAGLKFLFQNV